MSSLTKIQLSLTIYKVATFHKMSGNLLSWWTVAWLGAGAASLVIVAYRLDRSNPWHQSKRSAR